MLPFAKLKNSRPKAINVIRKVTSNVYRAKPDMEERLYHQKRKSLWPPSFIFWRGNILLK